MITKETFVNIVDAFEVFIYENPFCFALTVDRTYDMHQVKASAHRPWVSSVYHKQPNVFF